MFKVELYINGERADMFNDENISITDTIQNIKDPGSIFTAFSQTFSLPASKTNNKIFKHYYNNRVIVGLGGFDARFSHDAIIKINGVDYKTGTIRLSNVNMRKNKAYSYTVNFVGDGANVKDQILDDDLSVLSLLDQFNHDYSLANAKIGLSNGLGLSGGSMVQANGTTIDRSIIYPFISHTKRYVYDSTQTYATYNSAVTAGTEGLEYTQLKPAIKLIHIIEAIESRYNIAFTRDFFGDAEFDDLYMWLNRTKGFIEGLDNNTTEFQNFTFTSGDDNMLDLVSYPSETVIGKAFRAGEYLSGPLETWIITFDVTITGSGNYDFYVDDALQGGSPVYTSLGQSGSQSFAVPYGVGSSRTSYAPVVRIESPGTITQIDVEMSAERTYYTPNANYTPTVTTGVYDIAAATPNNFAYITALIPKMKVMDFLSGLFRMFNLTHYRKADGTVYVDTLDNFYALGSEIDITDKIDITESVVETPLPFDYISFKHSEPKTFLSVNRAERLNEVFGDEDYRISSSDGGLLFGGGSYEIKTGFSHIMMEHLPDLSTGVTDSNNLFGWAVDEDENATANEPLILYLRGQQTLADIDWSDGTNATSYMSLGNTNALTAGGDSLNFGVEFDEFSLDANTASLYKNYYENYIFEVYGSGARLVKYSARLTPSFLLNYNMYDKIIVSGVKHKINSITTNMIDGTAELELITEA